MRIVLLGNPDNLHVQRWVNFLSDRGHDLLLLADPHTQARPPGCELQVVEWTLPLNILAFKLTPRPHGNALWKSRLYRPRIAAFRPDVVHGFEAYYNGLATALSGPFPKVLSPWGRDIYIDGTGRGIGAWMVRRSLRLVDRISCNDETIAGYLSSQYGIPSRKVVPFSWGIDLKVFSKADAESVGSLRRELGIEPDQRIVLSPRKWGRLWGSDLIVDALPQVLNPSSNNVAVLIGPSPEDTGGQALKTRLDSAVDSRQLRWIDANQTPADMARLFSLADVFLSVPPRDLLAQSVLEGMACGCFPVLSDLPAYSKHASAPGRALRVEASAPELLATAILEALRNDALREEAAHLNHEAMQREEDASVNMLKMESVYDEAIEAHRNHK